MTTLREGDRVFSVDCALPGRITRIWERRGTLYYRAEFPPGSPFIDNWAVFRQGELAATKTITTTIPIWKQRLKRHSRADPQNPS